MYVTPHNQVSFFISNGAFIAAKTESIVFSRLPKYHCIFLLFVMRVLSNEEGC